jgi:hypothetical protein
MATAPGAETIPLLELFQQLDPKLLRAILDLAGARAAKRLRRASRAARALVNSAVEVVRLSVDDLFTLTLRLHERFPRLARLELAPGADGALSSDAFAAFAAAELAPLSSLVELDLRAHTSLGTAAAMALQICCPQLRTLDLDGAGAGAAAVLLLLAADWELSRSQHPLLSPQAWRTSTRSRRWPPSPAWRG